MTYKWNTHALNSGWSSALLMGPNMRRRFHHVLSWFSLTITNIDETISKKNKQTTFETLHFQQRLKIIYAVFSRQHVHVFPHQRSRTSMVISYREIFSASWFGSGINYRHVAKGECEITHCQVSLGMVSTILSFRYFWLVSMIRKKGILD